MLGESSPGDGGGSPWGGDYGYCALVSCSWGLIVDCALGDGVTLQCGLHLLD